jgi:hypothetical protein
VSEATRLDAPNACTVKQLEWKLCPLLFTGGTLSRRQDDLTRLCGGWQARKRESEKARIRDHNIRGHVILTRLYIWRNPTNSHALDYDSTEHWLATTTADTLIKLEGTGIIVYECAYTRNGLSHTAKENNSEFCLKSFNFALDFALLRSRGAAFLAQLTPEHEPSSMWRSRVLRGMNAFEHLGHRR